MLDRRHSKAKHFAICSSLVLVFVGCLLAGKQIGGTVSKNSPSGILQRSFSMSGCDWTAPAVTARMANGAYSNRLPLSDQSNEGSWRFIPEFSDEFNAAELDKTKWQPAIGGWLGRQPALIAAENVTEGGGTLNLRMVHQNAPKEYLPSGYQNYMTAAVESLKTLQYGYFEVRAKAMASGASSAFWLAAQTPADWNEIDLFEMGGKAPANPTQVYMTTHVFRRQGKKEVWSKAGVTTISDGVASNFHIYGLDWNASSIDMYVDGQQVRHICNSNWTMPLNMIFDAETVPDWWGLPQYGDLPATFQIDYVRVWQHAK